MESFDARWRRLARTGTALVLALALAAAGCTPEQESGSEWSVGDSGTDTGSEGDGWSGDGSDDTGGPNQPLSTTFRLENNSMVDITVHAVGPCATEPWAKLRRDGEPVDPRDSCGTCNCDDMREGICAVCGAPACTLGNNRRTVEAGSSVEWTWPGRIYREGTVDGNTCARAVVPDRGETFGAEICYVHPSALREVCETVEFPYGKETVVRRVDSGEDAAEPPFETDFVLHNDTNTTLQVEEAGCEADGPGWLEMRQDGSSVDPETDCTECKCSSVRSDGTCAVCGKPCEPGMSLRELEPGERATWTWAAHLYEENQVDGMTCREKTTPPVGTEFSAEFRWYPEGARGSVGETRTFRYGYETRIVERVD